MEGSNPISPVHYRADVETPEKDEPETIAELVETLRRISETTLKDNGHATRSVHAKSHGLLLGEITIEEGLPEHFRQGLFAKAGSHPVAMRFSTPPGDLLPDSVSTPRGLAVKVLEVEGARVDGSANDTTQDFVLVNGPAFNAPTAKAFLGSLKLLASTTDKSEGMKVAASAFLRGAEKVVEAFGGESPTLKSMGGHAQTHILGETFYSQTPLRFGSYIGKLAIAPSTPQLKALKDQPIETKDDSNALRSHVVKFFEAQGGEWDVRVQLCTDLKAMPIEDASIIWPEEQSPYVTVAKIRVAPQPAWNAEREKMLDDGLAFSPWHGLEDHRPLGSVNRARKPTYEMSAKFRGQYNGCPMTEPRTPADIGA